MTRTRGLLLLALFTLLLAAAFAAGPRRWVPWTVDGALVDNLSCLFLLGAAAAAWAAWRTSTRGTRLGPFRTRRNAVLLGFALLFVFGAGEEIDWGQRFLHFRTPAFMRSANAQHEFNIHNLVPFHNNDAARRRKSFPGLLLNFNVLFYAFGVLYFGALPVLSRASAGWARRLERAGIPVPPLWMGWAFPAALVLFKLADMRAALPLRNPIAEVKELTLEFLLLLLAAGWAFPPRAIEPGPGLGRLRPRGPALSIRLRSRR